MTNAELLNNLAEKKEALKKLGKLEKVHIKKLEDSAEYFGLMEVREQIKLEGKRLKELKELKGLEDLKDLNDVKTNVLHTKEGLGRREDAGIVMSEGNFCRLINAFMFFADFVDKSAPLLDIGTREGWFLKFLLKTGITDVQAIEVSPEAVEIVKNKGLRIIEMDVQEMNFNDQFGTITAIHVLEHCSSPKRAISNMYKALKKRGILYLEIPLEENAYPMKSGHFSSFLDEDVLFNLFKDRWERLTFEINIMNKAGTKRNLRSVWRKK